jgi:hypothetical protein
MLLLELEVKGLSLWRDMVEEEKRRLGLDVPDRGI